jgi:hypothetical protein
MRCPEIKSPSYLVILTAMLISLSSCEFGANAVDGAAIEPQEGMTFVYDNLTPFSSRSGLPVGLTIEIRLLSKMASVGGRDSVLGFVSSLDGQLIFTDIRNGELWYYFTANQDFERPLHKTGEWIRLPRDGEAPISVTIQDSVDSFEFPTAIERDLTVRPAGQFKFYVDGYHFNARKVKVTSSYRMEHGGGFERSGEDEQEITLLEDLGVIAEKATRSFGFETNHFVMSEIYLIE